MIEDLEARFPGVPQLARVVSRPDFHTLLAALTDWIERSRRLRSEGVDLLRLQAELGRQILASQDQRREFQRWKAEETDSDLDFETALTSVDIGIRGVRDVADGIAWRALNYDRLAIKQLAMKPQTGALQFDALEAELSGAIAHAESSGDIVVINDLTNFLRFGDLTAVGGDEVKISEVKAGVGSARSGKAKRQRRKLKEKLDFLNTGVGVSPDGSPAVLLPTTVSARSHAAEVKQLLGQSTREGSAHARLSDSLAVEVVRPPVIISLDRGCVFHNPFEQSPRQYVWHTYKALGTWTSNKAPFSVFPFASEDCASILAGSVWILSYCNLENIMRCFRRRGLEAHLPSSDEWRVLAHLPLGEFRHSELRVPIEVAKRGGALLQMSLAALARVFCEFLDEESVADQIEETLDLAADVDEELSLFGIGFANEGDIWD
jgi:hypothetical protein